MEIKTHEEYKQAFEKLDALIAVGFEGNAEKEAQFLVLAQAIEAYEDNLKLMPIKTKPVQKLERIVSHRKISAV